MKDEDLGKIRNIGIMAHIDAGKTTLTERILYYTGKSHKVGEVHDGNTVMDWMEQERQRGITITSASTTCFWENHQINLIDTPGHVDFTLEVERCLRVLDGAICVFDAVSGVEAQSETVWFQAERHKVPRICFVNKMDRLGADYEMSLKSMEEKLSFKPTVLHWPVGKEDNFSGVIDVVTQKMIIWKDDKLDSKPKITEIEAEYQDIAKKLKHDLLEQVSVYNDKLLDDYLSDSELLEQDLKLAIRTGTVQKKIFPVFCGSALKNKSVQLVLDAVTDYFPSPADVSHITGMDKNKKEVLVSARDQKTVALAFKLQTDPFSGVLTYVRVYSGLIKRGSSLENTTVNKKEKVSKILKMHANSRTEVSKLTAGDIGAVIGLKWTHTGDTICDRNSFVTLESIGFPKPVISQAIEPMTSNDEKKLVEALQKIKKEDPSFMFKESKDTGQLLVYGMGELHIEIILDRLAKEFGVNVVRGKPQVTYMECVTSSASGVSEFDKTIGDVRHRAKVKVKVEFLDEDKNEVVNESTLSGEGLTFASQGVMEVLENGPLSGFRVIHCKVTLVESSDMEDLTNLALKATSSKATREAMLKAKPHLLEPMAMMEVTVPKEFLGSVVGDLNSKRGKVSNVESVSNMQVIYSHVPMREVFGYATTLRSLTSGRGSFSMKITHFERLPEKLESQILLGDG